MKPLNVHVRLDDLMDTRLSTALSIHFQKAITLAAKGYDRRRGDWVIWEGLGITEAEWRKRYNARGSEILMKSKRSKLIGVIKEIVESVEQGPRISPTQLNVKITVNEYPYRLGNNVKKSIDRILRTFLHPQMTIDWIRCSNKQLTPTKVSSEYTHFIHYDLIPWLEEHINTQESVNLLNTELIGPALFQDKPTTEDFAYFKGLLDDVHQLSEQYVSPSWTIRFISVEYFNVPF